MNWDNERDGLLNSFMQQTLTEYLSQGRHPGTKTQQLIE